MDSPNPHEGSQGNVVVEQPSNFVKDDGLAGENLTPANEAQHTNDTSADSEAEPEHKADTVAVGSYLKENAVETEVIDQAEVPVQEIADEVVVKHDDDEKDEEEEEEEEEDDDEESKKSDKQSLIKPPKPIEKPPKPVEKPPKPVEKPPKPVEKPQEPIEPRYEFRDGRLYIKGTDKPFNYNVYPDRSRNQRHYEKLGNFATRYVYEQLVNAKTGPGLSCVVIPRGSRPPNDPVSFVFASRNLLEDKCERLLVLIHGSGAVRAGIWARSILINNSVQQGTQLPYIRNAIANGYGILVLNTNLNYEENLYEGEAEEAEDEFSERPTAADEIDGFLIDNCAWSKIRPRGYGRSIPHSESADKHGTYVWENFVTNKQSLRSIAIVAHSAGGCVTTRLANKFSEDFRQRVFAICFTDSVHGGLHGLDNKTKRHFIDVGKNWVSSNLPVGTDVERYYLDNDVPHVSAGDSRHEWTSHAAIDDVFKFLKYQLAIHNQPKREHPADQELVSQPDYNRDQDGDVKMLPVEETNVPAGKDDQTEVPPNDPTVSDADQEQMQN